jgi:hypothetical protein
VHTPPLSLPALRVHTHTLQYPNWAQVKVVALRSDGAAEALQAAIAQATNQELDKV